MRTLATGSIAIAVNQPMDAAAPMNPAKSDARQARQTRTTTRAVKPLRSIDFTLPTVTSSTFTADCGTRSRTSGNSTVTEYAPLPLPWPPGRGMLAAPLNLQPETSRHADTASAVQAVARAV